MKIPQSIRWRLPLSYATIALIAAVALGTVLLTTLRNFYSQAEINYLRNNAEAIGTLLTRFMEDAAFTELVDEQLHTFSFLSQTRVQLLDAEKNVIQDTGLPEGSMLTIDRRIRSQSVSANFTEPIVDFEALPGKTEIRAWVYALQDQETLPANPADTDGQFTIDLFGNVDEQTHVIIEEQVGLPTPISPLPEDQLFFFPARRTLFGFDFNNTQNNGQPIRRSAQIVELPLPERGNLKGFIRLSQGPAYGAEIVDSVAQGWLISSIVAVVLAAFVGLYISQRLTDPLLTLTHATTRMTAGDLTARATVISKDEVGTLASSFNKMAMRVEETIVTLRRFVADAAHELHTPLTALRTNLELIVNETDEQRRSAYVEQAQIQVHRLENLTSDLLELSRLEAISTTTSKDAINLTALIRATSESFASQAEQRNICFDLDLPPNDIQIIGDTTQVRQAISNLLENALKFTPADGLIRFGLSQSDKGMVSIWIEDNGIGIPSEDLPLLFSRFHRGRNAAAYAGSGLGLAIVKAIADAHNGTISVQTRPNGTQFTLHLPAS